MENINLDFEYKSQRAQRTLVVQKDRLVDLLEDYFLRTLGQCTDIIYPYVPDIVWREIADDLNSLGPTKTFLEWKMSFKYMKLRVKAKLLKEGYDFDDLVECEQKIFNLFGRAWHASDNDEQMFNEDHDDIEDDDETHPVQISFPSKANVYVNASAVSGVGRGSERASVIGGAGRGLARESVVRGRGRGSGRASEVRGSGRGSRRGSGRGSRRGSGRGSDRVSGGSRGSGRRQVRGSELQFTNKPKILDTQKDRLLSLVEAKFLQVVGRYTGPEGVEYKKRLWEKFASDLNLLGPARTGTEWKKIFDYMKSSTKASLNAIRQHVKTYKDISKHEAAIINMFGWDLLDGHRNIGEGGFAYEQTKPRLPYCPTVKNATPTNDSINFDHQADSILTVSEDEETLTVSDISSETEDADNLSDLKAPLNKDWKRETVMQGLTKNMQIRGDVFYYAPGSYLKLSNMGDVEKSLKQRNSDLTSRNFSFSSKILLGTFLQSYGEGWVRRTDVEMAERLEETRRLKSVFQNRSAVVKNTSTQSAFSTRDDFFRYTASTGNKNQQSDFCDDEENELCETSSRQRATLTNDRPMHHDTSSGKLQLDLNETGNDIQSVSLDEEDPGVEFPETTESIAIRPIASGHRNEAGSSQRQLSSLNKQFGGVEDEVQGQSPRFMVDSGDDRPFDPFDERYEGAGNHFHKICPVQTTRQKAASTTVRTSSYISGTPTQDSEVRTQSHRFMADSGDDRPVAPLHGQYEGAVKICPVQTTRQKAAATAVHTSSYISGTPTQDSEVRTQSHRFMVDSGDDRPFDPFDERYEGAGNHFHKICPVQTTRQKAASTAVRTSSYISGTPTQDSEVRTQSHRFMADSGDDRPVAPLHGQYEGAVKICPVQTTRQKAASTAVRTSSYISGTPTQDSEVRTQSYRFMADSGDDRRSGHEQYKGAVNEIHKICPVQTTRQKAASTAVRTSSYISGTPTQDSEVRTQSHQFMADSGDDRRSGHEQYKGAVNEFHKTSRQGATSTSTAVRKRKSSYDSGTPTGSSDVRGQFRRFMADDDHDRQSGHVHEFHGMSSHTITGTVSTAFSNTASATGGSDVQGQFRRYMGFSSSNRQPDFSNEQSREADPDVWEAEQDVWETPSRIGRTTPTANRAFNIVPESRIGSALRGHLHCNIAGKENRGNRHPNILDDPSDETEFRFQEMPTRTAVSSSFRPMNNQQSGRYHKNVNIGRKRQSSSLHGQYDDNGEHEMDGMPSRINPRNMSDSSPVSRFSSRETLIRSNNSGRGMYIGPSLFQRSIKRVIRTDEPLGRRPFNRSGRNPRNRVTSYEMVEESLNSQQRFIDQAEKNHLETISLCTTAINSFADVVRDIFGKRASDQSPSNN